jgi:hypothetical protein
MEYLVLTEMESQIRWHIPTVPALRRLRQKDRKFEASLGFNTETVSKKKKRKKERKEKEKNMMGKNMWVCAIATIY